jgi:hypothetical protein
MAAEKDKSEQSMPSQDIELSNITVGSNALERTTETSLVEEPQSGPKYLEGWRLHVLTVG